LCDISFMTNSNLDHPEVTKERLTYLAKTIPGAWIGLKIAALLLVMEGHSVTQVMRLY